MDVKKRLFRRPVRTVLWLLILSLIAVLLGTGGAMWYSSARLSSVLGERQLTVAVQTPSVTEEITEYGKNFLIDPDANRLTEEDVSRLLAMPQVKSIDFRYLSGAYIEGLTARIGLSDFHGNYSNIGILNETYSNCVLIGTVQKAWVKKDEGTTDLTLIGLGSDEQLRWHCAAVKVEETVMLHPDYPLTNDDDRFELYSGTVIIACPVYGKTDGPFFENGKRYVFCGRYDPTVSQLNLYDIPSAPFAPHVNSFFFTGGSYGVSDGNCIRFYRRAEFDYSSGVSFDPDVMPELEVKLVSAEDPCPMAMEWNGSAEELIESSEEWAKLIAELRAALSCFPVLGTDNIESIYPFLSHQVSIAEGRLFTQEEYESGAKVLIMDEKLAASAGIKVGDHISLAQFLAPIGEHCGNSSISDDDVDSAYRNFSDPTLGQFPFYSDSAHEEEEFTLVGLYRIENEWQSSLTSFTPNTVFMPRKAQLADAYGGPTRILGYKKNYITVPEGKTFVDKDGNVFNPGDSYEIGEIPIVYLGGVHGIYMSVILQNGTMEEFLEQVKKGTIIKTYRDPSSGEEVEYRVNGLAGHKFLTFDQGFEAAKESIAAVERAALRLFLIVLCSCLVLFLMYLLLYQAPERKDLGIMRSVGASKSAVRRYLFFGGFILVIAGFMIGTAVSAAVSNAVRGKLIDLTLKQASSSLHSAKAAWDEGSLRGMLLESTLPPAMLALLALFETAFGAAALYIHAAVLARKKPRSLLGV